MIKEALINAKKEIQRLSDRMSYFDKYVLDIQHELELNTQLKYHDKAKLAIELQDVLIKRRDVKNNILKIQIELGFISSEKITSMQSALDKLINGINEKYNSLNNKYICKVRDKGKIIKQV